MHTYHAPDGLRNALRCFVAQVLIETPLSRGDYGTANFDQWLRMSTTNRYATTLAILNTELQEQTNADVEFVLSSPMYFAAPRVNGLLVALVPKGQATDDPRTRHFCLAAAHINGVFESVSQDFTTVEL